MIELLYIDGGLAEDGGGLVCATNPGPCCAALVARLCGQPCSATFNPTTSEGPAGERIFQTGGRCYELVVPTLFDPPVGDITPGDWFSDCPACVNDLRDDCDLNGITHNFRVDADPCDASGDDTDCDTCNDLGLERKITGVQVMYYRERTSVFCSLDPCRSDIANRRRRVTTITRWTTAGIIRDGRNFIETRTINCAGTNTPWSTLADDDLASTSPNTPTLCEDDARPTPYSGFWSYGEFQFTPLNNSCGTETDEFTFDPPGPGRGQRQRGRSSAYQIERCRSRIFSKSGAFHETVWPNDNGVPDCLDVYRRRLNTLRAFEYRRSDCPLGGVTGGDDDDYEDNGDECDIAFIAVRCSGDGPALIAYRLDDLANIPAGSNPELMLLKRSGTLYRPTLDRTTADPVSVEVVFDESCTGEFVGLRICDPESNVGAPAYAEVPRDALTPYGTPAEGSVYVCRFTEWADNAPIETTLCYEYADEPDPTAGFIEHIEILGASDLCDPCVDNGNAGDPAGGMALPYDLTGAV